MAEKIKTICDNCGKPIYQYKTRVKKYKHHFCDEACYGKWFSRNITGEKNPRWKEKIKQICKYCGKEFEVTPSKIKHGRKFCSKKCYGEWRSENIKGNKHPNWKGGKVERICKQCDKKFKVFPAKIKIGRGKFCSSKCYFKAQGERIKRLCKYCGKEFLVDANVVIKKRHGLFCSNECKFKWQSIHFKGRSMNHVRKGQNQRPSKPERIFQEICQKNNIPFHYVGDGQLWIGKKGKKQMNPDFIEANGKKICIEIMGAWWHSRLLNPKLREDALLPYRKKHYKKYKWIPVFIWDTDLLRKDAEQFVLNELKKNGVIYERK